MTGDSLEPCPEWDGPHQWQTVEVRIKGRYSGADAIERCTECGNLRIDETVEVVEVTEGAE